MAKSPDKFQGFEGDDFRASLPVTEFSYDRETGEFILGDSERTVIEIGSLAANPEVFIKILAFHAGAVALDSVKTGVALDMLTLYGTPKLQILFDQAEQVGETQNLLESTREVIVEAHNAVKTLPAGTEKSVGFMGFDATLIRPGHPNLHTIGNCACLGVDPIGALIDESDWDTGYVEFAAHNIDHDVQWISLYAGIGHLSMMARHFY